MLRAAENLLSKFNRGDRQRSKFASVNKTSQNGRRVQNGGDTAYEVSRLQETVAMSKTQFPNVEDESIVNIYAIILLQQTSRLLKYSLVKWKMDKIKLEASFKTYKYAAYTDYGLRPRVGGLVQASVEVKRGIWAPDFVAIFKQETSQAVTMIRKGYPAMKPI